MSDSSSRISNAFARSRQQKHIALMPFIAAGFPDLQTTRAVLPALERGGAGLIEGGFPFSDPIADGPVIQAAFTVALKKELKVAEIFGAIKNSRQHVSIPLIARISYSVGFRYGLAGV